jgi:hypothetical protein
LPTDLRRSASRALLLASTLLAPWPAPAAEPAADSAPGAPTVEQVKAAYVVNFLRYTEWPAGRLPAAESPFVVCLVEADAVADELEAIAARLGSIGGHRLEVRRYETAPPRTVDRRALVEALAPAHVVYVGERTEDAPGLLRELERREILTIGDPPEFAESGGMIGLRREGNRVVFDANPEAIRATRLTVSARVLKLARIVEGSVP